MQYATDIRRFIKLHKLHYGDTQPYAVTAYRTMAGDAPLQIIREGEKMQGHPETYEYLCNNTTTAMLRCRRYRLAGSADSESITLDGDYPAGALDVTRATDPDGCTLLTFTDYQGNIRAVIDPDGTAIQTTDYYPYGLPMATSTDASQNRYKYGAKELETRNGLNFHDFEARMLFNDHTLFARPDDKAGKYPGFNPYLYCAANPIVNIDPDGNYAFLVPLIKGVISAAVDFGAQISVEMAFGKSFSEAFGNVDWTSVGASAVVGAVASPGMSTTSKGITATAIVSDAAVDVTSDEGIKYVQGGGKSYSAATIDLATSTLPGSGSKVVTNNLKSAISSDLSAKSAATLTKQTKQELKQAIKVIDSNTFQFSINATFDFSGNLIGGSFTKAIEEAEEQKELDESIQTYSFPIYGP